MNAITFSRQGGLIQNGTVPSSDTNPKEQNRRLWVVWLLFFFQFAAVGVYFTFLNVYFRQAGLSGTQIGFLNMASALASVASAAGWGYLSDRTGQNRLLIALGAVGALCSAQFIPLVNPAGNPFAAFLAISTLGGLLGSAPGTLVDSTALAMLGDKREDYGRYRLGGTFGYIITTMAAGMIFAQLGLRLLFPFYGILMLLFALTAMLLPRLSVGIDKRSGGEIGTMIRQPAWLVFIACVFLVWIATNASILFLGVALQSLGADEGLIGIAVTGQAILEIPFMLYSGNLLRRFGVKRLMIAAMALLVLRYSLLGVIRVPEWSAAANLINGPAYVLFWTSSVTYANRLAPRGMAGTAQGLLSGSISLAGVASALLTGWLFDLFGANGLFWAMAGCCLAALALFWAGNLKNEKKLLAGR